MEITRYNFLEQLDNITRDIKKSCFIGFDGEFTALLSGEKYKYRLFDTNEERYNLIKNKVSEMLMSQIGLTIYQYERDSDTYVAISYTFHLCPQVFGDIDQSFIFQASTLNFLCQHNFNFNKFLYVGIPYLSKVEEEKILQQIKDKSLFYYLNQDLNMGEERIIQSYCSEVAKWLIMSEEDTLYLDVENPVLRYLVHNEIRLRFPEMLTTDSLGNSNKVLVYRNENIEGAINAPMEILEKNLLRYVLGFSQIVSLLKTERKPIVGHNMFLDTVLLHNQFIGPLPQKYSTFKNNIHEAFPIIYDTKYISHQMKNKLSFDEVWKSNTLQDLYEFFSKGKCKKLENGVNPIRLSTPFEEEQTYHEAGWDSYCAGYCLVRLGHWAASELSGARAAAGPRRLLAALAAHCNKLNVIRGAVAYMNLAGPDPPCHRPDLLYVKCLKERAVNVGKVASVLAGFGSVDIKPYGRGSALVAAATQYTADRILKKFKDSREYQISKYNVYRHSPLSRIALWGGALIAGGLVLLLVHKNEHT